MLTGKQRWIGGMALMLAAGLAKAGGPIVIDFETDDFGATLEDRQKVDVGEEFGNYMFITGSGPNAGPAIFNSDPNFRADDDLLIDTGNLLILQSNLGNHDTLFGDKFIQANDDADGGTLFFDFNNPGLASPNPRELLSINLADIDADGATTVTLTDVNGLKRIYDVPDNWTTDIQQQPLTQGYDTLDLTILSPQPGGGSGGPATGSEDAGFDRTHVITMSVMLDGSGAVDNLVFVPEPASLLLLGMGGVALAARRRRTR